VTFHTASEALRKPGTVGRPRAGATIRIYDQAGRELPSGEIGEVYLLLEGVPDFTYHGLPEKRREIERDGFISIGDVGYLDEDDYLFLCDRKGDMVISGGVNIYPAEIEAALLALPGVRDCAVFGIPHDEFGETLCAHIETEPADALDEATIRSFLRERLADFKVPRDPFRDRSASRRLRQNHETQIARPLLEGDRAPLLNPAMANGEIALASRA
jgi:long-chain acyl-CoA synthetase